MALLGQPPNRNAAPTRLFFRQTRRSAPPSSHTKTHISLPTQKIGVSVWDTAGQDRFSSLTPFYFRGAHGVVYVYDVTSKDSLQQLESKWIEVGGGWLVAAPESVGFSVGFPLARRPFCVR